MNVFEGDIGCGKTTSEFLRLSRSAFLDPGRKVIECSSLIIIYIFSGESSARMINYMMTWCPTGVNLITCTICHKVKNTSDHFRKRKEMILDCLTRCYLANWILFSESKLEYFQVFCIFFDIEDGH